MVISEQHSYVFVEHPMSGCTAIRRELIRHYGGEPVLYKHASIHDFKRIASPGQAEYFSFASIRNPMDQVVSKYLRHKHDPEGRGALKRGRRKRGRTRRFWGALLSWVKRRNTMASNASFEKFFLGLYVLPYTDWSLVGHKHLDHVMRFESLQDEFRAVVQKLELEYRGPVPAANPSPRKDKPYLDYYSDTLTKRAKFVFEPYLRYWGYETPDSWNELPRSRLSFLLFSVMNRINWIYYHFLR